MRGFLIALELKRGNLKLKPGENGATKLQNYHLKKFRDAGGYANVVRPENMDSVLNELELIYTHQLKPDEIQKGIKYE